MTASAAEHAATLENDARIVKECGARLAGVLAGMGDDAPTWLRELVDAHRAACEVASGDLAAAARRLRRLAEG
ncbi:hypothetical protein [Nonomuraea soli]|uniref:Uncharacterized protein n=1 Tax=Nonomuraea soli TaxID=1032476 RepID=A0A7W0CVC1_9ACTN|nr:hypothetical protein [Nonomuraea soli]MBA2897828.1 hypothetical protein [Nonomuraea soli]